jgi:hypothetical protein
MCFNKSGHEYARLGKVKYQDDFMVERLICVHCADIVVEETVWK